MSDTKPAWKKYPRTADLCGELAVSHDHETKQERAERVEWPLVKLCRQLEIELTAAQEKIERLEEELNGEDICGLCGKPGADKMPHPVHWPGERIPDGELVHSECESAECERAHAALTEEQRRRFLRSI